MASARFYFDKNKIWQSFGETDLAKKKKKMIWRIYGSHLLSYLFYVHIECNLPTVEVERTTNTNTIIYVPRVRVEVIRTSAQFVLPYNT